MLNKSIDQASSEQLVVLNAFKQVCQEDSELQINAFYTHGLDGNQVIEILENQKFYDLASAWKLALFLVEHIEMSLDEYELTNTQEDESNLIYIPFNFLGHKAGDYWYH